MTDLADTLRAYFAGAHPPGVVSAYLFGSHADGTAHRESDVDVAVVLDRRMLPSRPHRSCLAVELASELIAATHQNAVYVVALNDVSPELAARVITHGRRLYCADEEADHVFTRTALLRHADLRPFLERTRRLKLRALAR